MLLLFSLVVAFAFDWFSRDVFALRCSHCLLSLLFSDLSAVSAPHFLGCQVRQRGGAPAEDEWEEEANAAAGAVCREHV